MRLEIIGEWLRTQRRQDFGFVVRELETTKFTHVQKAQMMSIVQFNLDLNMALRVGSRWIDVQAAGHPQMDHDHPGGETLPSQPQEYVLRTAVDAQHPRATNLLLKLRNGLAPQDPRPDHSQLSHAPPQHLRPQQAHGCLNFRQFRHELHASELQSVDSAELSGRSLEPRA